MPFTDIIGLAYNTIYAVVHNDATQNEDDENDVQGYHSVCVRLLTKKKHRRQNHNTNNQYLMQL
jgi:hypothetical protein